MGRRTTKKMKRGIKDFPKEIREEYMSWKEFKEILNVLFQISIVILPLGACLYIFSLFLKGVGII